MAIEQLRDLLAAPARSEEELKKVLSPLGFEDIKGAWTNLLSLAPDPRATGALAGILGPLYEYLSRSPDPDMALRNLSRFSEASLDRFFFFSLVKENPALLGLLIQIFGYSQYLSDILVRDPEYLDWIIETGLPPREKADLLAELKEAFGPARTAERKFNALRRFKRRETLRIGARDILGLSGIDGITAEISWLAESCLQSAWETCRAGLVRKHGAPMAADGRESGFVIMGMGKLGGEELNFSSDIDLIFLYEENGETSGPARISNALFFTRLGEEILKAIGEMMDEGYCYRVDMRLRPEGRSGPLVRAIDECEAYYESWGETWERLALLKARPVAGDLGVGLRFLKVVEPFVFRRHLDYSTLSEIRRLKQRVEEELASLGQRHLKLGVGGIREIEFTVQTLQLLSGAQHPEVKEVNTLRALRKLSSAGLLDGGKAGALSEAYAFLRKAEHRLQMYLDRQLHTLPGESGEKKKLALRMGYPSEEAFEADLGRHTSRVREIFDTILPPVKEEESGMSSGEVLSSVTERSLRDYGFRDPAAARKTLRSLRAPLRSEGRWRYDSFLPGLLERMRAVTDPDLALTRLERFLSATGAQGAYIGLLQGNPKALDLLVSIVGGSEFLSRILIANPSLFDSLVSSGGLTEAKSREEMGREILSHAAPSGGWLERLDAIRRFRRAEVLRIGTRDLLGVSPRETVSAELTDLAETCCMAALDAARRETEAAHGAPAPGTQFALLGLGKLGGREMNYGSDLDVIAIFSGEGTTSGGKKPLPHYLYFPALVERVLEALGRQTSEGTAYSVDLRLRPMGEKGPLAQSLDSLLDYLSSSARPWEILAYARVRPVAGEAEFGARAAEAIGRTIRSRAPEARDIHLIREKMIDQRVDRRTRAANVKLGRGGIVDVEFIAQFLALKYGRDDPALRETGTLAVLSSLRRGGHISDREEETLRSAYDFFRRVEMRMRIVQDASLDSLPSDPGAVEDLARRLGDSGEGAGTRLLDNLSRHTTAVRHLYGKFIGGGS